MSCLYCCNVGIKLGLCDTHYWRWKNKKPMEGQIKGKEDLIGCKIGEFTVIKRMDKDRYGKTLWLCSCLCGAQRKLTTANFKKRNWLSCGCKKAEKISIALTKHGHARGNHHTTEYHIWCGMKNRCLNKNDKKYTLYGDRGIVVCDRWKNSFEMFFEDMGFRPKLHSLDRINNNGPYSPDNCRWATNKEQAANRRVPTIMQKEIDLLRSELEVYKTKFGELDVI